MVQLLFTLVFSAVIFRVMWGLGAREWVLGLLRDEATELRRRLAETEERLAELDADPDPDATTDTLRRHYEMEAAGLRRRIAGLA